MAAVKTYPKMPDGQFYACMTRPERWNRASLDATYEVLTQGKTVPETARKFGLTIAYVKKSVRRILSRHALLMQAFAAPEREECAKVCDALHDDWKFCDGLDSNSGPMQCAATIRARGNACPR
jgi:hypothetical protein